MRLAPLLAAPVLLAAATAHAATLTITPDQNTYQVGDLITLNVLGDAEGAAATGITGQLMFDADLADYLSSNQNQLQSENGIWDDTPLGGGQGFALVFSQLAAPFGFPLIPTNQLVATVVLEASGLGVLDVSWTTEGAFALNFFGLPDAPGTSVTIVPEPSTFALLGIAFTSLALRRRAQKMRIVDRMGHPLRLLCISSLAIVLAAATAHAATLTVTPDQTVYQVGDLITLNVLGDAEGNASAWINGRLLFDSDLAEAISASQNQLLSDDGLWDDIGLLVGTGFADGFHQRAVPFGFPLVPTNELIATVTLESIGIGVLDITWETEGGFALNFFGLSDAGGTSITIVPESSTIVMLGMALAILARRGRMRTAARAARTFSVAMSFMLVPSVVTFLISPAITAASNAADVCAEFLEYHQGDSAWRTSCAEALESLARSGPSSPASSAETFGNASAAMERAVWHVAPPETSFSAGNQHETSIAVDPTNPDRVFVIAVSTPQGSAGNGGFLAAMTTNGGDSWIPMQVAEGPNMNLPLGRKDPWAVFSSAGSLFISYYKETTPQSIDLGIPAGETPVIVATWDDGNQSFTYLEPLPYRDPTNDPMNFGSTDKPTMAVGPVDGDPDNDHEALWVLYADTDRDAVVAAGAELDENGIPILVNCAETGDQRFFCNEQVVAKLDGDFEFPSVAPGDIAVGPSGEVAASFIRLQTGSSSIEVHVSVDPDGLFSGATFPDPDDNMRVFESDLSIGVAPFPAMGFPPQPQKNPFINANLDWDWASGKLYLISLDDGPGTHQTEVVLYSSPDGLPGSWIQEPIVNKPDQPPGQPATVRSQFIPNIAVDQVTGLVAAAWQDPRRDDGAGPPMPPPDPITGQQDDMLNTESEAWFGATFDVSAGFGSTPAARKLSIAPTTDLSHLDYLGVAIHDGTAWVAWADNSQSSDQGPNTQDENCDGTTFPCMDLYVTKFVPEPRGHGSLFAGVATVSLLLRRGRSGRRFPDARLSPGKFEARN